MTQDDFAKHLLKMHQDEIEVRAAGQEEYAHDKRRAFRNFEVLAIELNLSREQILWIYLRKHLDGILAYINGHRSQRESIHGRVKDARMYLALLDGMFVDYE